MKIYLTTDTHFYHDKMTQYCHRPENHTEITGNNLLALNGHMTSSDVLIHLGDICIGKDEEAHELYIEPLRCKKWLIRGNHDSKSNLWYLAHGWDWVGYKFQDILFGKSILFSHTPVEYRETPSLLWGSDAFDLNIHGHYHNTLHRLQEARFISRVEAERNIELKNITERHALLALEYTDLKPVLLEDFLNSKFVTKKL